ncbi:MBL fold metallo-hydrolase [Pseudooceanicola aestuarii]|uniref:MBL fold metallo-hydrolase n=1 Tax=Pseudooceanicola aestuarii TaxID=2697319 RepID=UPI0013D47031|nr:MBL fold metallo-hydrolase [Pseudooceanicola aestuarii]
MNDFNPTPGLPQQVAPGLRRILCPNPSAFTWRGTNTYLLGQRDIAVIDPGPANDTHLDAILDALEDGQRITHILVTHSHLDHSPLARPLAAATGAPILAYGDSAAGQSAVMQRLAATADLGGGEGYDPDFTPDIALPDQAEVKVADWQVRAHWTPGHFGNHMCFEVTAGPARGAVFTGDLVMDWATSIVSPPDGDLTDFMASCARLRTLPATVYLPGHGDVIHETHARIDWLIAHRQGREADILTALATAPGTPAEIATRVYTDVDPRLLPAATRNVLAHLIDLTGKSRVTPENDLTPDAIFRLT